MDLSYQADYFSAEENHWWFVSRRNYILKLIKKAEKSSKGPLAILEIGCSAGPLTEELERRGHKVSAIDISTEAIRAAGKRSLKKSSFLVMDGGSPSFEKESFDFIIASDVLEHIKDDTVAISNWSALLKKGGQLAIFVPAFSFLWSHHDVVNHHFRRYSLAELKRKVRGNKELKVIKMSYWNFTLFLPVLLFRLLFKEKQTDNLTMPSSLMNGIFKFFLRIENSLLSFLSFPFGVSCFVLLEKENKA